MSHKRLAQLKVDCFTDVCCFQELQCILMPNMPPYKEKNKQLLGCVFAIMGAPEGAEGIPQKLVVF